MCHVHFAKGCVKESVKWKMKKEVSQKLKENLRDERGLQEMIKELERKGMKRATDVCKEIHL